MTESSAQWRPDAEFPPEKPGRRTGGEGAPAAATARYNDKSSVADPGSGDFVTPGSRMGKKSGSGSGMNPDHISESLETIFWG